MSHIYCRRLLVSLCLILMAVATAYSQGNGQVLKPVKDKKKGIYKQLTFNSDQQVMRTSEVQNVFQNQLGLKDGHELRSAKAIVDQTGVQHTRFQQFYDGVKVEDGVYIVHSKNGIIKSMNGEYEPFEKIDISPSISDSEALGRALQHVGAELYLWEKPSEAQVIAYEKPKGELVIVDQKLAYKFDVYALKPLSRSYVYVDAKSGEIIRENDIIHHADAVGTADTRYSGTRTINTDSFSGGYRLRDVVRGNGIRTLNMNNGTNYGSATDFVDNDNNWTAAEWDNADKDNAALDAHWGAEKTYDYFFTKFNRNSFDDNGAAIVSYVHFNLVAYGYPNNDNAFWDGQRMTYGDGTSLSPLTSLDVAAHEIGHAVCTYTANLNYSYESGAMNEGFSDIWAACVEYYAAPEKQTWTLGEDLGAVIRSLENPNSQGQPDTYQGSYWATGSADNGGVHTNSGVLNHWFYILTEGKTGTNDNGDSFSVTGIGIDKSAEIAYLLESAYLSSNSDYADARNYGIQAAESLYGAGSAEAIATQNAWYAVGIGSEYGGGTPDECATGTVTLTLVLDNYPEETSWTLKDSGGSTVASGGTYGSEPDGSTITRTFILADGDYNFTITDAYGDGICCSYGNGSYSLVDNGSSNVLASGGNFGSSETVSFCVEGGGAGDTQPPSTPGSLSASSITSSSATLSWSASTDNVAVTAYDVYLNGSIIGSTGSTSYNLTGLSASTSYSVSVRAKDAAGNTSSPATTSFTTTGSGPVTYCTASGNNASYEWIDLVQLGSISNSTGSNGGYGNFTSQSTNLGRGGSYTINFSAAFSGNSYREYWKVYIDFNQDGDFADSGEQVVSGSSTSSGTLSSTIAVPSSATLGSTRMRVVMRYNTAPSSCGSFNYGEVEDYTVNITSSFAAIATTASDLNAEILGDEAAVKYLTVSPNPVKDFAQVVVADERSVYDVRLTSLSGKVIMTNVQMTDKVMSIDMSQLPQGIYILSMKTERETVNAKIVKE